MESPFQDEDPIFETKDPLKEQFHPDEILERDEEIDALASALQDVLNGYAPPNVFVYGQTGVGKTATVQTVTEFLEDDAADRDVQLTILRVNCHRREKTYAVLLQLANTLAEEENRYVEGHQTGALWNAVYERMDEIGGTFLVVLDEVDKLEEVDELLYEFPRASAIGEVENAEIGIVGISNNFTFRKNLSPRVKSTLTEREIQFKPYDANELNTILGYYAELVFREGILDEGVVPMCAAITAQDTGDARRGLDLLETAGDIARELETDAVTTDHVEMARSQVDRANTRAIITDRLTPQMRTVLAATTLLNLDDGTEPKTKTIYAFYEDIVERIGRDQLSEYRVRDHLNTLDMFGLLEREEENLGRKGGRTYLFKVVEKPRIIVETLAEETDLGELFGEDPDAFLEEYEQEQQSDIQTKLGL